MKKLLCITVINLLIVTSLFIGCTKSELQTTTESSFNPSHFDQMGIEHNKGLNLILSELKLQISNAKGKETSEQVALAIVKGTELYYTNKGCKSDIAKQLTIQALQNGGEFIRNSQVISQMFVQTKASVVQIEPKPLSFQAKKVINGTLNVFEDSKLNLNEAKAVFGTLKQEAISNLSQEEAEIVLTGLSIAEKTLEYWDENFDEWMRVLLQVYPEAEKNLDIQKCRMNWKLVGEQDAIYGLLGGMWGAATAGPVTLGIGTLPGWAAGAIGAAFIASTGSMIEQVRGRIAVSVSPTPSFPVDSDGKPIYFKYTADELTQIQK